MKTKLIFASLLVCGLTNAQNTFPSSGWAGIGTTSPSDALDVRTGFGNGGIFIKNTSTYSGWVRLQTSNAGYGDWCVGTTGSSNSEGNGQFVIHDATSSTTRFLLHRTTGDVGIGTGAAAPTDARLHVYKSITAAPASNLGNGGRFQLLSNQWGHYNGALGEVTPSYSGGSAGSHCSGVYGKAISSNNALVTCAGLTGEGRGGSWANFGAYLSATAHQNHSFSSGVYAEMINPNLYANSWAGYFIGNCYRSGTDNFSSDRKLKNDIRPLEGALDKVKQLKPSTYTFKTEEYKNMGLPKGQQMGLIAQDLEEVFPELVTDMAEVSKFDENGEKVLVNPAFKSVQYISLIPVLISAIQEQQKLIEQLLSKETAITGLTNLDSGNKSVLQQNIPNPFTDKTTISYDIKNTVDAKITIHDLTGKQIKSFPINPGTSSMTLTSDELPAGIYIYSIVSEGKLLDSKRMVVSEK